MKKSNLFFVAACLAGTSMVVAGCGESGPAGLTAEDVKNIHAVGDPKERIKSIEANPTLSPDEKARRIAVVKQRNHLP